MLSDTYLLSNKSRDIDQTRGNGLIWSWFSPKWHIYQRVREHNTWEQTDVPSHAPGPAGNGGNVNKPAVRLTRILSAGLMTSWSRRGERHDDFFFFSTFISFPLFLSVPLFGLPPACRLALSVYLRHILFFLVFSPFFWSVSRRGEEVHVRQRSRRQAFVWEARERKCLSRASRPFAPAHAPGLRRAENRRECCKLQISLFTSVPKPFTLPFWSFIFNRAHSLHPHQAR